jgi:hypothetical protein
VIMKLCQNFIVFGALGNDLSAVFSRTALANTLTGALQRVYKQSIAIWWNFGQPPMTRPSVSYMLVCQSAFNSEQQSPDASFLAFSWCSCASNFIFGTSGRM